MHSDKKRIFRTNLDLYFEGIKLRCMRSRYLLVGMRCAVCDINISQQIDASIICEVCLRNIEQELPCVSSLCCNCGTELVGDSATKICKLCLAEPPSFNGLHAIGNYEGILADLIIRAKIAKQVSAISALNELLRQHSFDLSDLYSDYSLLAMPTPRLRLQQRGFNIADIFAHTLAKKYSLKKLPSAALTVPYYVVKQAKLNKQQRHKNKHLFSVNHKLPKKIIIVDDIVTTCSTVKALSKDLRANGVEEIVVWAFLRTQNNRNRKNIINKPTPTL